MCDLDNDIAERNDLHHAVAQVDQFLRCRKEPHDGLSEEEDDSCDHRGNDHGCDRALPCAFHNAVHAARADILTRIGGHGCAEGQGRQHDESVNSHDNDVGRDELLAEGIGERLHDDHGHGEDGLRNTRGNTETDQLTDIVAVRNQVFLFHVKILFHLRQSPQREKRGDELRDDGRKRHAGDAEPQIRDKHIVQHNVDARRHQQINQGGHGIAEAAQHAAENVVIAAARDAQADDDQIVPAPADDALGRSQKPQERHGDDRPHDHDDQGRCTGQHYAGADGSRQGFPLTRAKKLRHHNTGAHGYSHEENQHQIQNGAGASDRGQCVISHKAADNDTVHCVVELLGHISQKHGDRKFDDLHDGISHRHVYWGK